MNQQIGLIFLKNLGNDFNMLDVYIQERFCSTVLSGNNPPLLVGHIFFKIDDRSIIFLWKGVKCFCWGVPNRFRTLPADSGYPRLIFKNFSISKKAVFLWYTFGQNPHSTDDLKLVKITNDNCDLQMKYRYGHSDQWNLFRIC